MTDEAGPGAIQLVGKLLADPPSGLTLEQLEKVVEWLLDVAQEKPRQRAPLEELKLLVEGLIGQKVK